MARSIDEKWMAVKRFYEQHYRDENLRRFRFGKQPSDFIVNSLYDHMCRMQNYFKDFYFHHELLWDQLQKKRGMMKDPTKKRKAHE